MDDSQHGVQPVRQLGVGGNPERDVRTGDLFLGAGDPRRHRRLGRQEDVRHVPGAEAAHEPRRERDLSLAGQGGMATHEDQPEAIVVDDRIDRERFFGHVRLHQQVHLAVKGPRPPEPVHGVPAGGDRQPRARPGGNAGARPGIEGANVGILDALLRHVEVARHAHRRGKDRGPFLTLRGREGLFDDGHRESTTPSPRKRWGAPRRHHPASWEGTVWRSPTRDPDPAPPKRRSRRSPLWLR